MVDLAALGWGGDELFFVGVFPDGAMAAARFVIVDGRHGDNVVVL